MLDAEALYRLLFSQLTAAYGDALGRLDGGVALVGIRSGGAWLAERIAHDLRAEVMSHATTPVPSIRHVLHDEDDVALGIINVSLHRDDFASKGLHGHSGPTQLPFDIAGRRILLIDDVLYTGRTIRAAINELYDYGRPSSVELAVLVDRGGRELPFSARFAAAHVDIDAGRSVVLQRDDDGRFAFASASRGD